MFSDVQRLHDWLAAESTLSECRSCGTTLDEQRETCPQCGTEEIAHYTFD